MQEIQTILYYMLDTGLSMLQAQGALWYHVIPAKFAVATCTLLGMTDRQQGCGLGLATFLNLPTIHAFFVLNHEWYTI